MPMTYALFRRRNLTDLFCAVPDNKPKPPFISEQAWEFIGKRRPDQPMPRGFSEDVARFACQFQGFYAFREQSILERRMSSLEPAFQAQKGGV